jgi:hypothetical protein
MNEMRAMTRTSIKRHFKKHRAAYCRIAPLAALAVMVAGLALQTSHPFTSAEVAFTDAAPSGLAIVPASCPSSPDTGSCECGPAPTVTCGGQSQVLGGGITCTSYLYECPSGYTFDGNWCVVTGSSCSPNPSNSTFCPDGSPAPNGDASQCGIGPGGSTCPAGDSCVPSNGAGTCPAGYTLDGNICIFTGCPAGYTQTADSNGNLECVETTPTSCTPQYLCGTDGNLYRQNADCSVSSSPAQSCSYGCSGNACNPAPLPQIVTFSLKPSLVPSGNSTTITWNVEYAADCTVTGSNGDGPWPGTTGTRTSSAITAQTIYTLTCDPLPGVRNPDGTPFVWVDQTATVNIVPKFQEQ